MCCSLARGLVPRIMHGICKRSCKKRSQTIRKTRRVFRSIQTRRMCNDNSFLYHLSFLLSFFLPSFRSNLLGLFVLSDLTTIVTVWFLMFIQGEKRKRTILKKLSVRDRLSRFAIASKLVPINGERHPESSRKLETA